MGKSHRRIEHLLLQIAIFLLLTTQLSRKDFGGQTSFDVATSMRPIPAFFTQSINIRGAPYHCVVGSSWYKGRKCSISPSIKLSARNWKHIEHPQCILDRKLPIWSLGGLASLMISTLSIMIFIANSFPSTFSIFSFTFTCHFSVSTNSRPSSVSSPRSWIAERISVNSSAQWRPLSKDNFSVAVRAWADTKKLFHHSMKPRCCCEDSPRIVLNLWH